MFLSQVLPVPRSWYAVPFLSRKLPTILLLSPATVTPTPLSGPMRFPSTRL